MIKRYWVEEHFINTMKPTRKGEGRFIKIAMWNDIKDFLIEWHNLEENPEDLPTDLTSVLVIYSPGPEIWRGREWCEGYYYRGEWAANKGPRGGKRRLYNVIKWAYIPKNNDFPDQENGEKQERR